MNYRVMWMGLVAAGTVAALAGCNENTMDSSCGGSVTSATVNSNTNTLNAAGTFNNGQPIIELTMGSNRTTIPATDYTSSTASFDLTGLPSGTYTVSWVISCNGAGEQTLNGSKVTSITIH